MSEIGNENDKDNTLLNQWRQKIEIANRNNIFCHCRHCRDEWVDSCLNSACNHCGSHDIERIPCWQFPDG